MPSPTDLFRYAVFRMKLAGHDRVLMKAAIGDERDTRKALQNVFTETFNAVREARSHAATQTPKPGAVFAGGSDFHD